MFPIFSQQSEYRDLEIADILDKEAIEIARNSHIFLRLKIDHQPEEIERVHTLRTLQDGGDADVGRHNQTRRPHVQDRFKGRLLLHPSCKGAQETHDIFMEKAALPVQSASVRFRVHESSQTFSIF